MGRSNVPVILGNYQKTNLIKSPIIVDAEASMNAPQALDDEADSNEHVSNLLPSFDYDMYMSNMIDIDDFPDFFPGFDPS